MAMANGTSKVHVPRPTLHLTTVIDVLKQFGFSVESRPFGADGNSIVVCKGMGIPLPY
jgi:RNA 3'-terminal phosphate cyclase